MLFAGRAPVHPFRIDAWVVLPGRCRLSRSMERNQDRICDILAEERAAVAGHDPPRRTGHLAASVLGAHAPRRSGLCGPPGLHTFQPGQAQLCRAPGRLAVFVVPPTRGARAVSSRMEGRQRLPAAGGRAALRAKRDSRRGGSNFRPARVTWLRDCSPAGQTRGGAMTAFFRVIARSAATKQSRCDDATRLKTALSGDRQANEWAMIAGFGGMRCAVPPYTRCARQL